jgi:tRNA-Thr(GGU) m(6)t(6)A37 methyltransferase TsaA
LPGSGDVPESAEVGGDAIVDAGIRMGQGDGMQGKGRDLRKLEIKPIGLVRRTSPDENERDRSLMATIVLDEALAPALHGIEEWSHVYVIFWLDRVEATEEPVLHHPSSGVGIFAARSPIHPNPIGLTLVELVKREGNVLWVKGLDAYHGTPVLDIKPYPDWEQDLIVVTDFRVPGWLTRIMQQHAGA